MFIHLYRALFGDGTTDMAALVLGLVIVLVILAIRFMPCVEVE